MSAVADFYANRCVFVTGGTGFLGKVLIEKLLYSVPNISSVYMLIRPQGGFDAKQRLDKLLESKVFDKVRSEFPNQLLKVVPVEGDVLHPDLNLPDADLIRLCDTVSVVFHCAATVKFDEQLRLSVEMNVVGVERILSLCHKMKQLKVLVHASTAYANCDRTHILEAVYPPPIKPQKLIDALEWMNDEMVDSISPMLLGKRPNTYTFTKALAEYVLQEESGQLPVIIVRPSIIGSVWKEPYAGWTDNLNGPTGLFGAIGKGLLHSMMGDANAIADIVPVDSVANFMIVAGWHRANTEYNADSIPVVNFCSGRIKPLTWGCVLKSMDYFRKNPLDEIFRVPNPKFASNWMWRQSNILFNHLIPAYIIDFCMRIMGKRAKMTRIYTKLLKAVSTLEYFTSNSWDFQSKLSPYIWSTLSSEDQKTFHFDLSSVNWDNYLEMYMLGVKKYILKEDLSNLPKARAKFQRKERYTQLFNIAAWALVLRLLVKKSPLLRSLLYYFITALANVYRLIAYPIKAISNKAK